MLEPIANIMTGLHVQLEPMHETHRELLRALSQDEKISAYSPALKLKFDSWFNKALKNFNESRQLSFVVRALCNKNYYVIYVEKKLCRVITKRWELQKTLQKQK